MEAASTDKSSKSFLLFFNFPVYNCICCTKEEGSPDGVEVRGVTVLTSLCPQIDVLPSSLILSSLLESTPEHTMQGAASHLSLFVISPLLYLSPHIILVPQGRLKKNQTPSI